MPTWQSYCASRYRTPKDKRSRWNNCLCGSKQECDGGIVPAAASQQTTESLSRLLLAEAKADDKLESKISVAAAAAAAAPVPVNDTKVESSDSDKRLLEPVASESFLETHKPSKVPSNSNDVAAPSLALSTDVSEGVSPRPRPSPRPTSPRGEIPIADSDPRLAVFGAQSEKTELLTAPAVKADDKIISKKKRPSLLMLSPRLLKRKCQ